MFLRQNLIVSACFAAVGCVFSAHAQLWDLPENFFQPQALQAIEPAAGNKTVYSGSLEIPDMYTQKNAGVILPFDESKFAARIQSIQKELYTKKYPKRLHVYNENILNESGAAINQNLITNNVGAVLGPQKESSLANVSRGTSTYFVPYALSQPQSGIQSLQPAFKGQWEALEAHVKSLGKRNVLCFLPANAEGFRMAEVLKASMEQEGSSSAMAYDVTRETYVPNDALSLDIQFINPRSTNFKEIYASLRDNKIVSHETAVFLPLFLEKWPLFAADLAAKNLDVQGYVFVSDVSLGLLSKNRKAYLQTTEYIEQAFYPVPHETISVVQRFFDFIASNASLNNSAWFVKSL